MIISYFKAILKNLLSRELKSQVYLDELLSKPVVRSGIFQGMDYVVQAVGSSLLPKLIGSYEKELSSIFEALRNRKVNMIFDIGAAEGYYAVGLARMLHESQVVAFESTDKGRELLAEMARKNHVDNRVAIHKKCTIEQFEELLSLKKPDFILMDIEGGEIQLITSKIVEFIADTEMLIEVHPFAAPGVVNILCDKTKSTHSVTAIHPVPRFYRDYWKSLSFLQRFFCGKTLLAYMGEGRGEESYWLHFSPISQS